MSTSAKIGFWSIQCNNCHCVTCPITNSYYATRTGPSGTRLTACKAIYPPPTLEVGLTVSEQPSASSTPSTDVNVGDRFVHPVGVLSKYIYKTDCLQQHGGSSLLFFFSVSHGICPPNPSLCCISHKPPDC